MKRYTKNVYLCGLQLPNFFQMNSPSPFPPGSLIAAYIRDSGGEEQEMSTAQQERMIRAFCAENNLVLTHLYIDVARSAKSAKNRGQFADLVNYFRDPGKPEAGILLYSSSRFARNLNEATMYGGMIRGAGYRIYSLTDPLPDGPLGVVMGTIKAWANEDESIKNSKAASDAQKDHFQIWGTLGGRPPIGFKRDQVHIDTHRTGEKRYASRWVPDPEKWDLVKQAWLLRAAGRSYREINDRFHLFASVNSFTTMFRNPIYRGEMKFADLDPIPNYVDPMVDQATWDAVQAQNKTRANPSTLTSPSNHPRRDPSRYLLTGLLFCSECGAPMNGKYVKFAGKEETWEYYICSNKARGAGCKSRQIPMELVDQAVLEEIRNYVLQPDVMTNLAADLVASYRRDLPEMKKERAHLSGGLATVRKRLRNLTNAIAETGHSPTILASMRELEASQASLVSRISAIEQRLKAEPRYPTADRFVAVIARINRILASGDNVAINRVLRGFIQSILVGVSKSQRAERLLSVKILWYPPPDELIEILDDPTGSLSPKINAPTELFSGISQLPVGALII